MSLRTTLVGTRNLLNFYSDCKRKWLPLVSIHHQHLSQIGSSRPTLWNKFACPSVSFRATRSTLAVRSPFRIAKALLDFGYFAASSFQHFANARVLGHVTHHSLAREALKSTLGLWDFGAPGSTENNSNHNPPHIFHLYTCCWDFCCGGWK